MIQLISKNELKHVETALKNCGYPDWIFRKVKQQIKAKKENVTAQKKQKEEAEKSKGMVVFP